VELQRYLATLLLYALGIGAVENHRLSFLNVLFSTVVHRENREDFSAARALPPSCLFDRPEAAKLLEGMDNRYVPMNDWLYNTLRNYFKRMIPNDNQYTLQFDKLEILMALSHGHHSEPILGRYWAPPGSYGWRHRNREQVINEIKEYILREGDKSWYVKSGIFGDTIVECTQSLTNFLEFTERAFRCW